MLLLLALACSSGEDKAGDPADTAPAPDTDAAHDSAAEAPTALQFASTPKNILMIALDTTRRDTVGRHSGDTEITPTLDALMAGGVSLDDHRSCSNWTYDAVLCVQTGRDPYTLDFKYVDEEGAPVLRMPDELDLVSEAVKAAGFQTGVASGQAFMSPNNNMTQGLDATFYEQDASAGEITDAALNIASSFSPDQPWYLHLHYMDPHDLYVPPDEYLGGLADLAPIAYDVTTYAGWDELLGASGLQTLPREEQDLILEHLWVRYRGELKYFDDQLARLMTGLEDRGLLDETLVVFWTDHGEQLWQHNYPTHGGSLFDEEVRSTAFFWAKGITPMAWTSPTTHKDIWPTILAALGIEHDMELTGLPLGDRPADEALFALRYRGPFTFHSVVKDRQKLVYLWNGEKGFYRLDTDPTEVSDAYDPEDPDVQALWELLLPEVEAVYAAMDGAEPVDPGL